jgi:hypothetical protein
MSEQKNTTPPGSSDRVAELETRVAQLEYKVRTMQDLITNMFETLATGNDKRREAIDALGQRLERTQERFIDALQQVWDYAGFLGDAVAPLIDRVFPSQQRFRDELHALLKRKSPG